MSDNFFAEIYNKILTLFGQNNEKEDSKNTAVNRLRLVLMQDKTNLTPEIMNRMRAELINVLSRYVVLDQEALDLNIGQEGEQMALMLSIPVVRAKDEKEIEEALKKEEEELKAAQKELEEKSEETSDVSSENDNENEESENDSVADNTDIEIKEEPSVNPDTENSIEEIVEEVIVEEKTPELKEEQPKTNSGSSKQKSDKIEKMTLKALDTKKTVDVSSADEVENKKSE